MTKGKILIAFYAFPEEAAYIGRLLSGYGELEYQLQSCADATLKNKAEDNLALRTMFATRGESNRLTLAAALMQDTYRRAGLEDFYIVAMKAIDYCREIRNQYAHCHWLYDDKHIFFVNLEATARQQGNLTVTLRHVDKAILAQQESYFAFTLDTLEKLEVAYKLKQMPKYRDTEMLPPDPVEKPQKFTPPNKMPPYNSEAAKERLAREREKDEALADELTGHSET